MWYKGFLNGFNWEMKVYEETGISKLNLTQDGRMVVNFDRGWDIKPQTAEQMLTIRELITVVDTILARKAA